MNRRIILVVVVIALVVLIIALSRRASRQLPDFSVEDAGNVQQISLITEEKQLVIRHQDGEWILNDTIQASRETVHSFLGLMEDLEIKSPVSEEAFRAFREEGFPGPVQVRISMKGAGSQQFLLFRTTENDYGNIVQKKPKGKPYILHVPGYNGDIGVFFSTRANDWKPNILFSYGPGEISRVSLRHHQALDDSFEVSEDAPGSYRVSRLGIHEPILNTVEGKAVRYISYFFNIPFEEFTSIGSLQNRNLEVAGTPLYTITVEDRQGEVRVVDVYTLFIIDPLTGEGTPDPNLAFARINQEEDPVIVKYFLIDPILKDVSYFFE